jgi:hypothetical protein
LGTNTLAQQRDVFYEFYGNTATTTYQGGNPWSSDYVAVWHLANGTTQSLVDSSGTGNSLTANSTSATAGKIDGASSINQSGLTVTSPTTSLYGMPFTFSGWVNPVSLTNTNGNSTIDLFGPGFDMAGFVGGTGALTVTVATQGASRTATSSNTLTTAAWQYVVYTYVVGAAPRIYLNGAETSYASRSSGCVFGVGCLDSNMAGQGFAIGALGGNTFAGNLSGALDEMRVSGSARSSDWIATEYNNQSSPNTFYTIGSELSGPRAMLLIGEWLDDLAHLFCLVGEICG